MFSPFISLLRLLCLFIIQKLRIQITMFFFFLKKGNGKSLKDLTQEIKIRSEFYWELNWELIGKID